jgi:two-component system cell cycle response regulator CpdR
MPGEGQGIRGFHPIFTRGRVNGRGRGFQNRQACRPDCLLAQRDVAADSCCNETLARTWDDFPMTDETAKILLAEDDTDMRRFLVKALQNAGFNVVSYDNGLSAYHRLREEPFELLLTDIVMPEMDGIELARRASELDPDIKIMFITGFAAVALNADSQAPKHAKVLSKPVHLRDLVNEVQKMLAA